MRLFSFDSIALRCAQRGDCLLWQGATANGYGRVWDPRLGKVVGVHRLAYEHWFGSVPVDMCVLHRCDVRTCVAKDHLFLGTYKDNAVDCATKGRNVFQAHPEKRPRGAKHAASVTAFMPVGEALPQSRLTADGVKRLRASGDIAAAMEEFNVCYQTAKDALNKKTWRHVL